MLKMKVINVKEKRNYTSQSTVIKTLRLKTKDRFKRK